MSAGQLMAAEMAEQPEVLADPSAGSWLGTSFLNPARDGAVLPILHVNGYKIAGPSLMGRDSDADIGPCCTATATLASGRWGRSSSDRVGLIVWSVGRR